MCSQLRGSKDWVEIGAIESSSGHSQSSETASSPSETPVGSHPEVPCCSTASQTAIESKPEEPCSTASQVASEPAEAGPASSSSSCCRICQDSADTDEPLETSRCFCRGQLAKVHRSCLVEWVRYKGSNHCEICCGTFRGVAPPPNFLGINQLEHLDALRQRLSQFRPLSRRKRTALAGLIIFLVVASGLTGILTFSADKEFQYVTGNPEASNHELKKAHIVFSICLSFLFFCVTLTLGLILMWITVELYFFIQRRRIMQHATRRLLAEIRQRSHTEPSTSV